MKNFYQCSLPLLILLTIAQSLPQIKAQQSRLLSICNADKNHSIECFKSSHPQIYNNSLGVVRLVTYIDESEPRVPNLCTGFRVARNLILTTDRCGINYQGAVNSTSVYFNYKQQHCNNRSTMSYSIVARGAKLVKTDSDLHYTLFTIFAEDVLKIDGWRGPNDEIIPVLDIDFSLPVRAWTVYVPQHPYGEPLQVAIQYRNRDRQEVDCQISSVSAWGSKTVINYDCDAVGSSESGSPVIDRQTHKVIAINSYNNGCNDFFSNVNTMKDIYPQIEQNLRESGYRFQGNNQPSPNCVWLYKNIQYKGFRDQICLGADSYSIHDQFRNNDEYSSIKVGVDVKAKLYRHVKYITLVKTADSNIANFLTLGIDDEISSIKIELKDQRNAKYCITLYQLSNYAGYNDTICLGNDVNSVENSFPGHFIDYNYLSVKVGSMVKAELYRHPLNNVKYVNVAIVTSNIPSLSTDSIVNGIHPRIFAIKIIV